MPASLVGRGNADERGLPREVVGVVLIAVVVGSDWSGAPCGKTTLGLFESVMGMGEGCVEETLTGPSVWSAESPADATARNDLVATGDLHSTDEASSSGLAKAHFKALP